MSPPLTGSSAARRSCSAASADETVPNAEALIEEALAAASEQGIAGQEVTPFVLAFLQERSDGRALAVNRDLIVANARLAAEVAVAS